MKLKQKITKINDKIAMNVTVVFGTMWTTYLFFLYGLLPVFFPQHMDKLLYWSNTVQLWSLPLLMVGTNLLGRDAERRNQEMYDMIKEQLEEMKEFAKDQKSETELEAYQNNLLQDVLYYLKDDEDEGTDI